MIRLWSSCTMEGESLNCAGYGDVQLGERFQVQANGMTFDVVVHQVIYAPGEKTLWRAMDAQSNIDRYERAAEGITA